MKRGRNQKQKKQIYNLTQSKDKSIKDSKYQCSKQKQTEKCSICLDPLGKKVATMNCGHKFCSQECGRKWWRDNIYCPYCRTEIQFLQNYKEDIIVRDEIAEKSEVSDSDYIPQCYQCRADIQQNQNIYICKDCSTAIVHKQCLPFKLKAWQCFECAQNEDSEGNAILPIIPYNPILHYLFYKKNQ